ncbi:acyltransferase family protein [Paractinoplanes atraurantiacus]|uniref:Peptidoglycan/LPS O-acetylase OafA/YrhL, contains acyltransferase and SGNH-hydrolase domains n=1 Tax=Paractinoplanes atraurantiacus TaxID=1036182 RepID=A0A285JGB3_9ACTN|nr:acyltransferase family protein [Actinoplanes atraurantiacus]SNY59312.1 Peptidoglycan/LPS O-acetylase OafA/YrhL, contains acyltransferase and SGNH-hydrolase domains [Actinoplanes atraurantiacus]
MPAAGGRNRYLDLLRAAAIVRVVVYHLYGWTWLPMLLPAMGIMFALAGSLTAASLERRGSIKVIRSRLRRLLPPLWLLGLIAVPLMIAGGWPSESGGEHPFTVPSLLFWILPVGDPPGSDAAADVWVPLWYIRAYLWFVLLSPLLLLLWRRVGWASAGLPFLLLAALGLSGVSLPAVVDATVWDFATFGACWIAGFAHHDGRLARVPPWIAYTLAPTLALAALWRARDAGSWDLNDVPETQALWSFAFVLVILRWQPSMDWLTQRVHLDRAVTVTNARAVTIYLWHNAAIAAIWPVLAFLRIDLGGLPGAAVELLATLVLVLATMLAFGWAEDLAARRPPRLWPATGASGPTVAAAGAVRDREGRGQRERHDGESLQRGGGPPGPEP